jgi:hypothetical protein
MRRVDREQPLQYLNPTTLPPWHTTTTGLKKNIQINLKMSGTFFVSLVVRMTNIFV